MNTDINSLVVYEQLPNSLQGLFSNLGTASHQIGSDQFTLSQDVTITNIHWYGFYGQDLNPSDTEQKFWLGLFSDQGGIPEPDPFYENDQVLAQVFDTGLTVSSGSFTGRKIYQFQTNEITPFSVSAGETLWISIAENDDSTPAFGNTQWLWSFSPSGMGETKAFGTYPPPFDWESSNQFGQLAFALGVEGDNVEPSSITLRVNTTVDQNDRNNNNGLSLRDGILIANADPANNYVIELQENTTYPLTIGGSEEDLAVEGDLDIIAGSNIILRTSGEGVATIDATGIVNGDRVFDVFSGGNLQLENIIVTGGRVQGGSDGGGLNNNGNLILTNSTVSDNSALNGGGIYNSGNLTLTYSNVLNNATEFQSGIGRGGGGGIINANGSLILVNSTIASNSATNGGGLVNTNNSTATIINSTISGNSAGIDGGGIANIDSTLTISNSTFSDNTAVQDGGGIFNGNLNLSSTVNLSNTIIANSNGADITNGDSLRGTGSVITTGVNLVEDGSLTGSNVLNIDPLLASLQNQGGSTLTHALLNGSPVINAGNNEDIPLDILDLDQDGNTNEPIPVDQRGKVRIQGNGNRVDLGAFELQDGEDFNSGDDLPIFDTPINRFQNEDIPGTYLFAGEDESQNIRANFPNFREEGLAFNVADEPGDDLEPLYRFQSLITPGTYLFAGEEERIRINENFADSFTEEGLAFYVYGVGTGKGEEFIRFQNSDRPGTYLFAGEQEAESIRNNFPNFTEEGAAFEVVI